jgi:hypothetical protein
MAIALGELVHHSPTEWGRYHFENCSLTQLRLNAAGGAAELIDFNNCAHRKPFS